MPEMVESDRVGGIMLRVLAAIFAVSWMVFPGFGLIDLSVTLKPDPSWQGVLEAGWGLYLTLFVGTPFVVIAARGPSRSRPAVIMLYVAVAALAVSALLSFEPQALVLAAVIGLQTIVVSGTPTSQLAGLELTTPSRGLIAAAALGMIPWAAYAWSMWSLNRQSLPERDITAGVDHYSVQGAFAIALLALVVVATMWPDGRFFLGVIAGLAATYLGVVSWLWWPTDGGFDRQWSLACLAWGALVIVLSVVTRPKAHDDARPSGSDPFAALEK